MSRLSQFRSVRLSVVAGDDGAAPLAEVVVLLLLLLLLLSSHTFSSPTQIPTQLRQRIYRAPHRLPRVAGSYGRPLRSHQG